MARQETILTVFVASPSDVDEERNRLEEVIRGLNAAWSRELGIRLELVRWETHAYPSIGEDPQAVINSQIPDDFDLFIGLMWYRFGTPTGRAGSGTLEEFKRAKERFDRNPSSLQLMVYFKDAPAPLSPSKLDPEQIKRIMEFRSSLGDEGVLYWSFSTGEEFEKLVNLHLTRYVQAWRSKFSEHQPRRAEPNELDSEGIGESLTVQEDEPGLLDLMELFEDEFIALQEIMERISDGTVNVGNRMQERTIEIQKFQGGPSSADRKDAKRLIAKAAGDFEQYAHGINAEIPLFKQHLNSGMDALIKASKLSIEFAIKAEDVEQIRENIENVKGLREILTSVEEQVSDFQNIIANLPKMTTALNRAKRSVVNVLQNLIEELQGGQTMAREAEASFVSLLE